MGTSENSRFGKYRLLQHIGAGGMGEVHLAKLKGPSGFEKLVVVKRLLQNRQTNRKYIDMFFSEARVAAQLNHSNIVQIYEVGNIEGVHYIAMEYVQGKSLRRVLDAAFERDGYFPAAYVVQIVLDLCTGLAFAHDARHLSGAPMGLIHRDINPHNVLLSSRGEVKVIDFGIAKSELSMEQTQAGTIKGTVVYMSPEQASGKKLDKRSDLFSVGIVLYEALFGDNPFHKDSLTASLEAIRFANYPPLDETRSAFAVFFPLLKKALARAPEERYADCSALALELRGLLDSGQVPRASQSLSSYLQTLFERDIGEEERLLSQTELAEAPSADLTKTIAEDEQTVAPAAMGGDESTVMEQPTAITRSGEVRGGPASIPRPTEPVPAVRPAVPLWVAAAWGAITPKLQPLLGWYRGWLRPRLPPWLMHRNATYAAWVGAALLTLSLLLWAMRPTPGAPAPGASQPSPEHGAVAGQPSPTPTPPAPSSTLAVPKLNVPVAHESEPAAGTNNDLPRRSVLRHLPPAPVNKRHVRRRDEGGGAGLLQLQLDPAIPVFVGNARVAPSNVRLRAASGTLRFGTDSDPFVVRVRYRIDNKAIVYDVESEPWATVSGAGGITLGRTPVQNIVGTGVAVFELYNPKAASRQRVIIRFTPP